MQLRRCRVPFYFRTTTSTTSRHSGNATSRGHKFSSASKDANIEEVSVIIVVSPSSSIPRPTAVRGRHTAADGLPSCWGSVEPSVSRTTWYLKNHGLLAEGTSDDHPEIYERVIPAVCMTNHDDTTVTQQCKYICVSKLS